MRQMPREPTDELTADTANSSHIGVDDAPQAGKLLKILKYTARALSEHDGPKLKRLLGK